MDKSLQSENFLKEGFLPQDLRALKIKQLISLCSEIRKEIVRSTYKNGGHLASNLGVVELTVGLHYVLNTPVDKLIFDVGHQCYAHKLLTGRSLQRLRQSGGVSGFTNPEESVYDTIWAGHSSTSLSAALGLCRARDLQGQTHNVAALIGDASLGSGMAFEALNDIGGYHKKLVVILNDNEMSIEKNVGAMSTHLSRIRLNPNYRGLKKRFSYFLLSIPLIGKPLKRFFESIKNLFSLLIIRRNIFDDFGIKYSGPYDGHNLPDVIKALKNAVRADKPVLLHFRTVKGKGHAESEHNPTCYHGVKQHFNNSSPDFSRMFGQKLAQLAKFHPQITAVTAAMCEGTGLKYFAALYGDRYFDVGICEQHAVTMCAGMATGGLKPYFAVYSTFLQRAFDQVSNDICIPRLPVTLVVDRAGITGSDGETHHGVLDVALLTALPGMTVYAPADISALNAILDFSTEFDAPLAIRYGNRYAGEVESMAQQFKVTLQHVPCTAKKADSVSAYKKDVMPQKTPCILQWRTLTDTKSDCNIITYGNNMMALAFESVALLKDRGITCGIIDAACIKPLDTDFINSLKGTAVVLEEVMPHGSLFSALCAYILKSGSALKLFSMTVPERYIGHGVSEELLRDNGVSAQALCDMIAKV